MKITLLIISIIVFGSCKIESKENDKTDSMQKTPFTIKKTALTELSKLRKQKKFEPNENYMGVFPAEHIPWCNQTLNESIDRFSDMIERKPSRQELLSEVKTGLNQFNNLVSDTEDREMVCHYFDTICEIIGIQSTDGIINSWLYD